MVFRLLFRRVPHRLMPELLLLWTMVPGRHGKIRQESVWRAGFRAELQEGARHPDDRMDLHLFLSREYLDTGVGNHAEPLDTFRLVRLGNASDLVWDVMLSPDLAVFLDPHSIIV